MQAEAELKARKQQKEAAKSINQLKQLAAELDAEEQTKAAKALRKQVRFSLLLEESRTTGESRYAKQRSRQRRQMRCVRCA